MARGRGGDPYLYPGTDVLRNKLGLQDDATLRQAEYAYTRVRSRNMPAFPMSVKGYLATHWHLFQDLYDWAGKLRTVTLSKGGSEFAFPYALGSSMESRFADLTAKSSLCGLSPTAFASGAAHHISELNAIHPFREGNGRAMRLHLQQLAAQAGHRLEQARLPTQGWIEASIMAFHDVNEAPLAGLVLDAIVPVPRRGLADPATPPEAYRQLSPDGRLIYAALAETIERQMARQGVEDRAALRAQVARELVAKEEREGPVLLTPDARRLAAAAEPPASALKPEPKPKAAEGQPMEPPGSPRRKR